jgi:hypothetical protein
MTEDLFSKEFALTPQERKKLFSQQVGKKRGYVAPPGTGPEGETCRSCQHSVKRGGTAGTFYKCALNRSKWTGGYGTDILLRSPACSKWERAS